VSLAEREKRFTDTNVYPVITPEFCQGRSPLEVLEAALKGGAKIVQLRDKTDPERYASAFREISSRYGALLMINDSVDLALKYGADGVHLGATDLPIAEARKKAPELLIGASIHNLEEALAAQEAGASYINIGPIFPTRTKPGVKTFLGVKAIQEIALQIKIPFTVMGGINKGNIQEVLRAGARHIAMVTAITEAADVEKITREFINLVEERFKSS
jgi:thiamine-phosphate pyrophosphorylase